MIWQNMGYVHSLQALINMRVFTIPRLLIQASKLYNWIMFQGTLTIIRLLKTKVFKLSPLDYGSNGPSQDMPTLKLFQVISRLAIPHKYYNWWEKDPTNLHSNEYKDKTRIEVH